MTNLLKWILFAGAHVVCRMGGDSGGGGDTSGQKAQEDEDRKTALRGRIDKLYGISTDPDDPEALAAKNAMAKDDSDVSGATRSYYADQLARSFGTAERNNRFALARQGLQGGSADIDTNAELQTDQNLGATRIDQAARAAAAGLDAQREQERLNATNLVNAGAGEDAVLSAQTGLKNSLNNVASQSRADLTGDLFTGVANQFANSNFAAAQQSLLPLYQKQLAAYFPASGASAGRVTPSG